MGHRLSKIVTRTGDAGETGLADGSRLPKSAPRVAALGEVDELNCVLGLLLARELPAEVRRPLARIQHELFDLGGELSLPGAKVLDEAPIEALEAAVRMLNQDLPPLKEFVLPGGNEAAAIAHLARAVCRRAERALWTLNAVEPLNPCAPRYLNRLSDLLFVCARVLARSAGGREVIWQRAGR
ncbi:MAG: cob(I)yrinic acid a,c-diamide adenosyltransferase [Sinobacteraceae bacterium]|nr:cob(I)yrinic acid a,c-diamide adenosyltransferase [Nevskiaceae bacterium]